MVRSVRRTLDLVCAEAAKRAVRSTGFNEDLQVVKHAYSSR